MPRPSSELLERAHQECRDLRNQMTRLEQPFREEVAKLRAERDGAVDKLVRMKRENDATIAALKALIRFISVSDNG